MLIESLSSPEPQVLNHAYTNAHHHVPHVEPWSDVFESDTARPHSVARDADPLVRDQQIFREHSDIPRLQAIHSNAGYRDGITQGKGQSLQAGFDEGYGLGGEIGRAAGWIIGSLEGVVAAAASRTSEGRKRGHATVVSAAGPKAANILGGEERERLQHIIERAKQALSVAKNELDAGSLYKEIYITDEAVWGWHVEDEEGGVFKDIAMKHPLLIKWRLETNDIIEDFMELSSKS